MERLLKNKWVQRASATVMVALVVSNIYLLHRLSTTRNRLGWVESVAQTAHANAGSALQEGRTARQKTGELQLLVADGDRRAGRPTPRPAPRSDDAVRQAAAAL